MADKSSSHDFLYIMAFITMIASCDTCSKADRIESKLNNMKYDTEQQLKSIEKKITIRFDSLEKKVSGIGY